MFWKPWLRDVTKMLLREKQSKISPLLNSGWRSLMFLSFVLKLKTGDLFCFRNEEKPFFFQQEQEKALEDHIGSCM